jgi:hypothetical protein
MKIVMTTLAAGLLAASFTVTADAATKKDMRKLHTQHERSCKAEAAKRFTALHFMKRRAYVKRCMGQA